MPKFKVNATFDLTSEMEPDGIRFDRYLPSGVEDFDDDSSFYRADVETSGGEISFTVTAEDEDAAQDIAYEVINDGQDVEDDNDITWQVANVSIEIEEIEPEMTRERAVTLLKALLDRLMRQHAIEGEEREAIEFLIDTL